MDKARYPLGLHADPSRASGEASRPRRRDLEPQSGGQVLELPVPRSRRGARRDVVDTRGDRSPLYIPGLDDLKPEPTTAFVMDRHEVTNRRVQEVRRMRAVTPIPKYWTEPFVDGASALSLQGRDRALRRSHGASGTVDVGSRHVSRGHEELSGRRRELVRGGGVRRMGGEEPCRRSSTGTASRSRVAELADRFRCRTWRERTSSPAGSTKSMNRCGVYDLAGNVREWTWNASDARTGPLHPRRRMERSGLRVRRRVRAAGVRPLADERLPLRPLPRARTRISRRCSAPSTGRTGTSSPKSPCTMRCSRMYLRQFAYDKTPLDAKIEEESTMPSGVRQKITFNAAYGGERMMAYCLRAPAGKAAVSGRRRVSGIRRDRARALPSRSIRAHRLPSEDAVACSSIRSTREPTSAAAISTRTTRRHRRSTGTT